MEGFTECPNCVKDRLVVPLRNEGDSRFCPLCESIFRMQKQTSTLGKM